MCCLQGWLRTVLFTKQTPFKYASFHTYLCKTIPQLVERPSQCVHRSSVCTFLPNSRHNAGHLSVMMGNASRHSHDPGQVDFIRGDAANQPPETQIGQICLSSFPTTAHSKHTKIMMDNTSCMFFSSRQGGARFPSFCAKSVKLWNWCICNQIAITAACLPRVQNVTADAFSRHILEDHE